MKLAKDLIVGDVILYKYGSEYQKFTVMEVIGDKVLLGKPTWLNSSAIWMRTGIMDKEGFDYVGHAKKNILYSLIGWTAFHPYNQNKLVEAK